MKSKAILLVTTLIISLFIGCAKQQPAPAPTQPKQTTPAETTPNVVTTASIVNNEANFKKAISSTGTWIIAITQDMTINDDLVVDGEFKNGKKDNAGKDQLQRKIALYAQDENRKVTAKYTLTAPKITFNSPYGSLEHGTFKGDVYVAGRNFKLVNQKIDGNLYFLNEDAQKTFTIQDKEDDTKSTVTGKQELKK